MGYFSHIILALAAIVAAESGLKSGWSISWAPLVLIPIPHLLAAWIRRRSLRGEFRKVATATRVLTYLPVILQVVAVSLFGWTESVSSWVGSEARPDELPELSILLSLAPFILFEFITIDARSRLFAVIATEVARLRNFQYRMFLSGLVPIVIYMALAGILAIDPNLRAMIEEVELFHALFALVSLTIFAMALPAILRNTWETVPLTGGMAHAVLTDVARRANFQCNRLLVWKTGNQLSNAAILGFFRRQRTVLFSDSLLAELHPRELAAVFAHEIGHARRKHVLIFAAWTIAFFLLADLVFSEFASSEDWIWMTQAGLLVLGWYLGFGYLSRRFELDADLESLEITNDGEALISALENVGGAHARNRPSWRHFSTAKRVLFMRATINDPGVGARLRSNLRLWTRAGFGLFLVASVLELIAMSSHWSENWITANLRMGRYNEAYERVEVLADDEPLAQLVTLAAGQADARGFIAPIQLDALAQHSLRNGDARGGLMWLELSARRGLYPAATIYQQLSEDLSKAEEDKHTARAVNSALESLRKAELANQATQAE